MNNTQTTTEAISANITTSDNVLYEAPAVIYEGMITTRAGTPTGNPDGDRAVDPADLFGN